MPNSKNIHKTIDRWFEEFNKIVAEVKQLEQESNVRLLRCKKCGCKKHYVSKSKKKYLVITCGDCQTLLFDMPLN